MWVFYHSPCLYTLSIWRFMVSGLGSFLLSLAIYSRHFIDSVFSEIILKSCDFLLLLWRLSLDFFPPRCSIEYIHFNNWISISKNFFFFKGYLIFLLSCSYFRDTILDISEDTNWNFKITFYSLNFLCSTPLLFPQLSSVL